jgi:hypothetical protein
VFDVAGTVLDVVKDHSKCRVKTADLKEGIKPCFYSSGVIRSCRDWFFCNHICKRSIKRNSRRVMESAVRRMTQ